MAVHDNDQPRILLAVLIDAIGPGRLPSLFHAANFRVELFSPTRLALRKSRFVHRHWPAAEEPAAFAEQLCRHLTEHPSRYVWIQFGDETVLRAATNRCLANCPVAGLPVQSTPKHIALITDKLTFLTEAAKAGLPVPAFALCTDSYALSAAVDRIGFPLMIKRGEWMAGSGVRCIPTKEDIASIDWDCSPNQPLMVQSFIEGLVGSTEVLFDHGCPVAWINSFHREFWPNSWAASCVRELTELPEAEEMLNRLGALTGYHGLAGVDWLRSSSDRRLHLIELNPRPTPCYHLGPRVGVDFSRALRELIGGSATVQRPAPPSAASSVVYQFPQYCYRAIDDRAFARLARVLGDVPWNDPLLVGAHLRRVISHYLPRKLRDHVKKRLCA